MDLIISPVETNFSPSSSHIYDDDNIIQKINAPINWNRVGNMQAELKSEALNFFNKFEF